MPIRDLCYAMLIIALNLLSTPIFTLYMHAVLSSADIKKKKTFQTILSRIPSGCQTVWIQIRPDILSGLIWVQTVCKIYLQTTPAGKGLSMSVFCLLLAV